MEPINHTPAVEVGLANIPAPIAVPAIIIAPPSKEGCFFCVIIFSQNKNSHYYSSAMIKRNILSLVKWLQYPYNQSILFTRYFYKIIQYA